MTHRGTRQRPADSRTELAATVILVGVLWTGSSLAYAPTLTALGWQTGYNASPAPSAFFYVGCLMLAAVVFRRALATALIWKMTWKDYAGTAFAAGIFVLFAAFAPSLLPSVAWQESWPAPDILLAAPAYFVPKSVDILFQQILVVVLVATLARHRIGLRAIALTCVVLFGGTHLLLALDGLPLLYVTRFTISASLFALLFPYLILRVPNGFIYSYGLHWSYYAATLVTARTLSPYVS